MRVTRHRLKWEDEQALVERRYRWRSSVSILYTGGSVSRPLLLGSSMGSRRRRLLELGKGGRCRMPHNPRALPTTSRPLTRLRADGPHVVGVAVRPHNHTFACIKPLVQRLTRLRADSPHVPPRGGRCRKAPQPHVCVHQAPRAKALQPSAFEAGNTLSGAASLHF